MSDEQRKKVATCLCPRFLPHVPCTNDITQEDMRCNICRPHCPWDAPRSECCGELVSECAVAKVGEEGSHALGHVQAESLSTRLTKTLGDKGIKIYSGPDHTEVIGEMLDDFFGGPFEDRAMDEFYKNEGLE